MSDYHIKALDLARQGEWHQSHELIQQYSDRMACLIHAYLHRVEGDSCNAQYWYTRAGENFPDNTLEQEFERLYKMMHIRG